MLTNATSLSALAVPYQDARGAEVVLLLAKATYVQRAGALVPADEPAPVRTVDVPTDADAVARGEESSLRHPSDVGGAKPGADVVVLGDATSRRRVTTMDVTVRTPERTVVLRVHGPRTFRSGVRGVSVTPALPFERASLTFEHAWGGVSRDRRVVDWRNPVGRGVHASPGELDGAPAPTVEDPAHPIEGATPSDPVGFGAVAAWWSPRRELAGTMDATWQETRMPLPPVDFDPRFHHVAHPRLQVRRPLRPGDAIATMGIGIEGAFQVTVPPLAPVAHLRRTDAPRATVPLVLDLALLEPERGRVELTYRGVVPLGRGATLLREARLDADA